MHILEGRFKSQPSKFLTQWTRKKRKLKSTKQKKKKDFRRRGRQRTRRLDGITDDGHESERIPGDGEGQETWRAAVHGVKESQT